MQVSVVGASKYEQKQGDIAAAVSVITRQEIDAFGWRTLDQALSSLPGIYTTFDRQSVYLGVRGFGLPGDYNTRVLVTINGNRLNDPTFDGGLFGRQFPVEMDLIERIEFIPGPGGAVYGQNAMFGVVNIVTRTGAEVNGAELTAGYQVPQSLREGRASWGERLDNGVDILMSVSGMSAHGQNLFFNYGASGISGIATGLDGERGRQFLGSVARGPWSFEIINGVNRKDDPTGSGFSDPLVPNQFMQIRETLSNLQYRDDFAANTLHVAGRLFAGESGSDVFGHYETMFAYPSSGDWWGGEVRAVSTALAGHTLMAGLEAQDNTRENRAQIDFANAADNIQVHRSGYRAGLYAQDEWRLSSRLESTLGLRIDRNDNTGTALSPRAALIWQAAATTVKALYGIAHRAPNAFENSNDFQPGAALPSLTGETINTLEFSVDQRIGRELALRASVYQWSLRDIIVLANTAGGNYSEYQNGKPVKTDGIELSTDKTWDSGARLRDSVSYQHAEYRSGGDVVNSPKVMGKLDFSTRVRAVGLRVGYELRVDGPRLTLNGTMLGGYALSNVYLSEDSLAKGLKLSLAIDNLAGKRYAQPASASNWQNALEQDGRSAEVKVSYAF